MKKRSLSLWLALVLAVVCSFTLFAAAGCDKESKQDDKNIQFSQSTNPYADKTWQEYGDLFDWNKKRKEDPVYYMFEGSYSEAYQGDYSRTYLYMNCYEDGTLHAKYGNNNYYGYWTNVDKYGRDKFVLYIVRYNNGEYNDGIYASPVEVIQHDCYEYKSSIIWNQWGARTVLIYGFRYSPVKTVNIDSEKAKTSYLAGENFTAENLRVSVTRENGKTYLVEEVTGNYTLCKYSGYDKDTPGEQDVTVTYDGGKSATYKVKVLGPKSISLDTTEAKTVYYVGDKLDTSKLVVKAVMEDNNEEMTVASNLYKTSGFDSSRSIASQTVTVTYGGKSATYTVEIKEPSYTGNGKYNGASEQVTITIKTDKECEVTFDSKTVVCEYSKSTISGKTVYTLMAPEAGITGATEEEWNGLHKQYSVNNSDMSLAVISAYTIPSNGEQSDKDSDRYKNEPMPSVGGGTEQRTLVIDEGAGTATITYKYWYASTTGTVTAKYTLDGNTLTLTEQVSANWGGAGGSWAKLTKVWTLNDDGTATAAVTPAY